MDVSLAFVLRTGNFEVSVAFASTSLDVGYSPMNCLLIYYLIICGQRNMKLVGDGLVAFTFNMGVCNLVSELVRQRSCLPSLLHVQVGAPYHTIIKACRQTL